MLIKRVIGCMNYIIYGFFDKLNNPFYVGKTKDLILRGLRHLKDVKRGDNTYKCNKLRKLLKELAINEIMFPIKTGLKSDKEANYLEKFYIKKIYS